MTIDHRRRTVVAPTTARAPTPARRPAAAAPSVARPRLRHASARSTSGWGSSCCSRSGCRTRSRTWRRAKQILNANAITALAALSITIPLAARVFDLSFAGIMTLTGVAVAHLIAKDGVPLVPAIALALAVGLGVGLINAVVVVVMRIDSFIAHARDRLADRSADHDGHQRGADHRTPSSAGAFAKIGQTNIGGITLPVVYCAVVAVAIWYLLEHTATGRRLYATGFNPDAARLAGVRIDRLRFLSLVASGGLAGAAGIVLASTLGSGSPSAGTPYLLPAFAAAFLGATQLKHGRFNAGGTIIAVLLLGTGVTGLALANAPQWAGDMFVGVVLIAALALTGLQRRTAAGRRRTPIETSNVKPATGGDGACQHSWPEEPRTKARRFSCSAPRSSRRAGCGGRLGGGSAAQSGWRRPASPRRRRWPRRRPRGRRPSGSPPPSASRSRPARRSSSSAAASRPARSRATSSSRARPTSAGPPRRSATDGSPEQLQNAFKTALRQGADAVILNAVNRATVPSRSRRRSRRAWPS